MSGADALRDLLCRWDESRRPLTKGVIRRGIGALHLEREDVADYLAFSEASYQRLLIGGTTEYEALLLCWRSGQRSPIHDHAGSICGIRIIEGTATETTYTRTPCGYLVPTGSRSLGVGAVSFSCDRDVHQMANLGRLGEDLITLHVYSPPLSVTRAYSISETTLADHDRLMALRPRLLRRPIRVDGAHVHSSSTPMRASQVRP
jgi:cysteine dioxygenase